VIAIREGVPHDANQWGWSCGFYPGSHPAQTTGGNAATFEKARAAFEAAWALYLPKRTETTFKHGAISGTGPSVNMQRGKTRRKASLAGS
jgi:hypothetical protein